MAATISASQFKARCLGLIDQVAATGEVLVITKTEVILLDTHVNMYVCRMGGKCPRQGRYRGGIRSLSTLHRPKFLDQQCLGFIQLESVAGGAGEEELALSNKASGLDSIAASRLFSCFGLRPTSSTAVRYRSRSASYASRSHVLATRSRAL
jgi:hypothetical protein